MPENIATSPDTDESTSGTSGASSPESQGTTSGNDPQSVELRRKITEQAEEVKRLSGELTGLRSSLSNYPDRARLVQFIQDGTFDDPTQASNGGDKIGAEEKLAEAFENIDSAAFVEGVRSLREELRQELSKQYAGELSSLKEKSTDTTVRNFFTDKQAPDQAKAGSDFWKYAASFAANGTPEGRAANTLLQTDIDAGLAYVWSSFVATHGDPTAELRKRQEVETRRAASLDRGAGLPSNLAPYVIEEGGPKRRDMTQLYNVLKAKGVFRGE